MTIVRGNQIRGITRDITILDSNGDPITVVTADHVRVIICRLTDLGGTAAVPTGHKLLVTSVAPTVNGSSITKNTPSAGVHRLRLDAQDLTFEHGTYTMLVDFFDDVDGEEWKTVDEQVFILGERF